MERLPAVFLSSTFFDLRQVRADLRDFVEKELGYRLVASEYVSFPVDPASDTIENCRRRVESDTDIFVLLVGSRYGSIPAGENFSVTNIEYLAARAHGIPIYAFIHRDVISLLPVWQANSSADFGAVVDTPKLFEFVAQVRSHDRVWSFPFETAQEIVAALRTQLAFQMRRGLELLRETQSRPSELRELRGPALQLAVEQPTGWQSLLLAQEVEDQLYQLRHLRNDHRTGYAVASAERISATEAPEWLKHRIAEARRITEQLTVTLTHTLNDACEARDIPAIGYGARRVAVAYREALEWASRIRSVHVPEPLRPPLAILATFLDSIIDQLDGFAPRLRKIIAELRETGSTQGKLELAFTVDEAVSSAFDEALDKATDEIVQSGGTT